MRFHPIPSDAATITSQWLDPIIGPTDSADVDEIGTDFGFGGTTYRARGTIQPGESRTVVIKLATAERTRREIDFYGYCAPTTPIRTPGFIGGDTMDGRGVVVLEYLADLEQGDVLAGCSESQFMALASALGRLHGRWWGAGQSELDSLRISPRMPPLIEARTEVALARHPISDHLAFTIQTLPERLEPAQVALYAGPMTLTHRDFHLDNVLFDGRGQPVILDWQSAAVGPPAMDVARLFVDCRPRVLTSTLVDRALATYLETLPIDAHLRRVDLRRQIRLAFDLQLAASINWLGRADPGAEGPRMAALEHALLDMLDGAIGHFNSD